VPHTLIPQANQKVSRASHSDTPGESERESREHEPIAGHRPRCRRPTPRSVCMEPTRSTAGRLDRTPGIDTSGYVRRARRLADLSQRDLASAVRIAQPRIARIESGGAISVEDFARILASAGLRITVVDREGTPVEPMPNDVLRDGGGRRQPAHLDVHARPELPTTRLLLRSVDPVPRASWYYRRSDRDRLRLRDGRGAADEQLTARAIASRAAARSPRRSRR
jgi:transcriptional regulator with XRE-family HTH domain